jgi:hypothetical protein
VVKIGLTDLPRSGGRGGMVLEVTPLAPTALEVNLEVDISQATEFVAELLAVVARC